MSIIAIANPGFTKFIYLFQIILKNVLVVYLHILNGSAIKYITLQEHSSVQLNEKILSPLSH